MQTAKQLSVGLANKPGRFAAVLDALAKEKVHLRAFCVMDSGVRATVRMVPDDPQKAQTALKGIGIAADVSDVLLVELNNQSGGLPRICQRLAEEHLNIDYAYGSLTTGNGKKGSLAVIKVNDLAKAQRVLSEPASAAGRPRKVPGRRPTYARQKALAGGRPAIR